jgi:uncharacterized membrane protein
MSWFHWMKVLHLVGVVMMVGVTFVNGLIKMKADRSGDLQKICVACEMTIFLDWALMVPGFVLLIGGGIGAAMATGYPLHTGWLGHGVVLTVILVGLASMGIFVETRLHRIAVAAYAQGAQEPPPDYWKWTRRALPIGFLATALSLLVIGVMVSRQPLFSWAPSGSSSIQMSTLSASQLQGRALLHSKGCIACHSLDGAKGVGPTLQGILGSTTEVVTDGIRRTVTVDTPYMRRSILHPAADVVIGFDQVAMPRVVLSEGELQSMFGYLEAQ